MRFLSREWLARMESAAAPVANDVSLAVHQRVTGGPDGDVEYTLRIEHGAVSVEPGPGTADVEIVQDYETASAISQGRLSPAAAFAAGRLRLSGSVSLLVEHHEAVAVAAACEGMAVLPSSTTY